MFDFLLFDADGTLFDFDRAEAVAVRETLASFGLPHDDATVARYHKINASLWHELELRHVTRPQLLVERFARLLASFAGEHPEPDPAEINARYGQNLGEQAFLFDGAEALCRRLCRQKKLYLVTNGNTYTQRKRLALSGIADCFADVFISEEVGYDKPSAAYFDYVANAVPGFDRKRAVIVGDSLSSDICGGNNAGIHTVWYNPEHKPNNTAYICDDTVENYEQLYPILLGKEARS